MSNETISVPPHIGLEPLVGLYYPARCRRCGWVGSSEELTEDDAQCTRDIGDRLCLGDCDELDSHDLLGIIQAMAQHQGEPVAKSSLTFEFLNPLTKDRRTVSLTHAQVADGMEDTLYEKLNEEICSCEPVGETNVVECNCWDYTDDFDLVARQTERPEPISSTSDKYKAELYDEVWQKARDMGFGNVTDALMKLDKQLRGEPVGHVYTMEALVPGGGVRYHAELYRPLPSGTKLYAEQPAPAAVVLPERKPEPSVLTEIDDDRDAAIWNACIDEVARLNPTQR
ncbi:hypothetical protein [Pseudomonas piscis]|uniref:hypothetical protein n=1 Tax=Pseudomonas piscis TaxID=2614538 RepID=UPI000A109726|nr:hypothetical protein [Pseudomonas piscis]